MQHKSRKIQPSGRAFIVAGCTTLLSIPYLLLAWRYWFLCDDAFISFRYGRNLARGHGLRFNVADDPVEGYSNLAWVLLSAVSEGLLLSPTMTMTWISAACGVVLLWRLFEVAHRRLGLGIGASLGGGLIVAMAPPFGLWATSGLETMAFALAIFVAWELLVFGRGRGGQIGAILALIAVLTLRGEGPAWVVVLLGVGLGSRRLADPASGADGFKHLLPVAAAISALVLAYLGWRLWVFGDWIPNTARAKVAISWPLLGRGARYVGLYALTFPAQALLVLLALPVSTRRWPGVGAGIVGLCLAFPAFAWVVGGDFFPMGRLMLPGLPFLGLITAALTQEAIDRGRTRTAIAGLVLAIGVGLGPAADLHLVPHDARALLHFRLSDRTFLSEHGRWANLVRNTRKFTLRGKALRRHTTPDQAIVARAIGAMGYYSDLHVFDQYGLIDPEVASRPLAAGPLEKSPGHDREVGPAYFGDQDPDLLFARYVAGRSAARLMRESLRRWAVPSSLRARYVPDFVETQLPGETGPAFLFLLRRVAADESAAKIWRDWDDRLKRLSHTLAETAADDLDRDAAHDD